MTTNLDKQALLVMDVQPGILERLPDASAYLAKIETAVAVAHDKRVPVIYIVVGFRPGMPEVTERNRSFAAAKKLMGDALANPQPAVPPQGDDLVVVKRRVSAFSGSDLEVILRAHGIQHLVLAGIATSGVVLSTLREAADKDYGLTVLSDLCADPDAEVHALLIGKVFPRQAAVIAFTEWAGSL